MAHRLIEEALRRLAEEGVDRDDLVMLRHMLTYFDRNSLWPARWEGSGGTLVFELANDSERFRLPLAQMRELYAGIRSGRPVDWARLERVR